MTRLAVLFSVLVLACQTSPPAPGPAAPVDASDGAVAECDQPGPADDCRAAGVRLCALGCRVGNDQPRWKSPKGTPYAEACRRAKADGRDTMSNGGSRARCLASIQTCAEVGGCR